jgi:hypothetical protein
MRIFAGDLLVSGSAGDQRGNMTGSNTLNSPALSLRHIQGYSIQAVYSTLAAAGVTGSIKLQCSNDPASTNHTNPTNRVSNWTDINGSTQAIQVSGSNNTVVWNVGGAYYSWVRVQYTNTSGSGSLDLRATGKGPQ